MYVSLTFYQYCWTATFCLQGLFVVRGLVCDRASVHYKNCLTLKIKFNFMIMCSLLTLSLIFIALVVNKANY